MSVFGLLRRPLLYELRAGRHYESVVVVLALLNRLSVNRLCLLGPGRDGRWRSLIGLKININEIRP